MSTPLSTDASLHHSSEWGVVTDTVRLHEFNVISASGWPTSPVVWAAHQLNKEYWSKVCCHTLFANTSKFPRVYQSRPAINQLHALDFSKQASIVLRPCSRNDFVAVIEGLRNHEYNLADLFPQLQKPAESLPHLMLLCSGESDETVFLKKGDDSITLAEKLQYLAKFGLYLNFPLQENWPNSIQIPWFHNPFKGLGYEGLTPLQLSFVLNREDVFAAISNILGPEITQTNLQNLMPYAIDVFKQNNMQDVLTKLLKYEAPAWHQDDGKTVLHDVVLLDDDEWFKAIAPSLKNHYLNSPKQFLKFLSTIDEQGYTALDCLGLNIQNIQYQTLCSWMDDAIEKTSIDNFQFLREPIFQLLVARCLQECIALKRTPEVFSEGLTKSLNLFLTIAHLNGFVNDHYRLCHHGLWNAFVLQQKDMVLAARRWAQSQLIFDRRYVQKESFLDAAIRCGSEPMLQMELNCLAQEHQPGLVPFDKRLNLEHINIIKLNEAQLNLLLKVAQQGLFYPRQMNVLVKLMKRCVNLDHAELFKWFINSQKLNRPHFDLVQSISYSGPHTEMVHQALLLQQPKIMTWLANGSGVLFSTWCTLTSHRLKTDIFDSLYAMNLKFADVYSIVIGGYNPLRFDNRGLSKLSYLFTSVQLRQAILGCIHANHHGPHGQNVLHHAFRDLHTLQLSMNSGIYDLLAYRDAQGLAPLHHALKCIKFWGISDESLQKSVDSIIHLLERGPVFVEDFGTPNSPWRLLASNLHNKIPRQIVMPMFNHLGAMRFGAQRNQILGLIWADLLEGGCKAKAVYETLAQFGVPISWQNACGENLLHSAVRGMQPRSVIQYLLDLGLNPSHASSQHQRTPLDLAILLCHQPFQEVLHQNVR